jgi:hypothetical protein
MARIRTIKPDFWTDEKIVELSFEARLFFIGSWNFADDNGNLQRSARKLKMQIFPADAIDCEPLIQSLMTHGLFREYEVNGEKFIHIKGFKAHQVINRPSKTGLPVPDSGSSPTPLTESSLTEGKGEEGSRKGKEGNGKERNGVKTDVGGTPPATVRPSELSAAMRKHSVDAQPGDPRVIAAAEAGITVETVEAACAEAKSSDPTGRIKAGFVLAIAERWTRDAAAPRPAGVAARPGFTNARDESRQRAYQVLTGKTAAPQPEVQPAEVINGHVKLLG